MFPRFRDTSSALILNIICTFFLHRFVVFPVICSVELGFGFLPVPGCLSIQHSALRHYIVAYIWIRLDKPLLSLVRSFDSFHSFNSNSYSSLGFVWTIQRPPYGSHLDSRLLSLESVIRCLPARDGISLNTLCSFLLYSLFRSEFQ